jgi:hypothetical protein
MAKVAKKAIIARHLSQLVANAVGSIKRMSRLWP